MSRLVEPKHPRPTATETTHVRRVGHIMHPGAWWLWAIGCAVSTSLALNPVLLAFLLAAVTFVVLQRRTVAPWARSIWVFYALALFIIVIRVFFYILLGGMREGTVLFTLPHITLPDWMAGISLGGAVTLDGLLTTAFEGARLGALMICIGAANSLANPKRALKALPPAFHHIATALVVAVSVIPQTVEAVSRISRAQRLRGVAPSGVAGALRIVVPVLEDSIDRSLALAAGMESRGYGRTLGERKIGLPEALCILTGMMLITFSVFMLLGTPSPLYHTGGVFLAGLALSSIGMKRASSYLTVTRYRPQQWTSEEWVVTLSGLSAALLTTWMKSNDPAMWYTSYPLTWPQFSLFMIILPCLVALPGIITTPPPEGEL